MREDTTSFVIGVLSLGLGLVAASLLAFAPSCVQFSELEQEGSVTGPSAFERGIDKVEILPSQFELVNGQTATATLRAFIGSNPVADPQFFVSISPNQSVVTIVQHNGAVVVFKAENPGFTNLVASAANGVQATAQIRVIAAN